MKTRRFPISCLLALSCAAVVTWLPRYIPTAYALSYKNCNTKHTTAIDAVAKDLRERLPSQSKKRGGGLNRKERRRWKDVLKYGTLTCHDEWDPYIDWDDDEGYTKYCQIYMRGTTTQCAIYIDLAHEAAHCTGKGHGKDISKVECHAWYLSGQTGDEGCRAMLRDEERCDSMYPSCISGTMHVKEQSRGLVRVDELHAGDMVPGVRGEDMTRGWCRVLAIVQSAAGANATTFNGFTSGHVVVTGSGDAVSVSSHGTVGVRAHGPVYTLLTDCDANNNAEGTQFTPLASVCFPSEVPWTQYLSVMAAIRRVVAITGAFWFDTASYHDNATATFSEWSSQIPLLCATLRSCAVSGDCAEFEKVTADFVRSHVSEDYVLKIEHNFPRLGEDVDGSGTVTESNNNHNQTTDLSWAGTISQVVRPNHDGPDSSKSASLATVVAVLVPVVVAAVGVIALFVHRHRRRKVPPPVDSTGAEASA